MTEYRFEVSDGATGQHTITGLFTDPLSAWRAFERCHGDFAKGVALVYRLDGDDEAYSVNEDGGISPIQRVINTEPDYKALWTMAHVRADRHQNMADLYWSLLSDEQRRRLANVSDHRADAQGESK